MNYDYLNNLSFDELKTRLRGYEVLGFKYVPARFNGYPGDNHDYVELPSVRLTEDELKNMASERLASFAISIKSQVNIALEFLAVLDAFNKKNPDHEENSKSP